MMGSWRALLGRIALHARIDASEVFKDDDGIAEWLSAEWSTCLGKQQGRYGRGS